MLKACKPTCFRTLFHLLFKVHRHSEEAERQPKSGIRGSGRERDLRDGGEQNQPGAQRPRRNVHTHEENLQKVVAH